MTTLEAHEYFARRGSNHDIFPHDVKLRGYPGCDIWAAVCVAAVGLRVVNDPGACYIGICLTTPEHSATM